MTLPSPATPPSGNLGATTVWSVLEAGSYRCVCGESFAVAPEVSVTCPHCGRHYAAGAFQLAAQETMVFGTGPTEAVLGAAPDDRVGKTLGHFRLLATLGQGGMGTVYRALDESLQRYVAVKVIRTQNGSVGSPQVERLVREARAQARVNHPCVVHIYFIGREGETPFFAMELVSGATLAQRLQNGPLPYARVIHIAQQVVDALRHAAMFDIIHGDIKPSNVLEADIELVKISDFGLAQRISSSAGGSPVVMGTPNYLAPEVARGEPTSIQSDMYSLGVTLFELTFGRLPFELTGSSLVEKLRSVDATQIKFPEPWPATVPVAWRAVLERLMAKPPEARYPSYDVLADDLRRLVPISFVTAGRVPRALAALVDLVLVQLGLGLVAMAFLLLPSFVAQAMPLIGPPTNILASLSATLAGAGWIILASLLQAWWGTTPGKRLFQLRIVDEHGLSPGQAVLLTRGLVQFLVCWNTVLAFGADFWPLSVLSGLVNVAALIDAGAALFSRQVLSIHDRIFRTRVVLDAQLSAQRGRIA